MPAPSAAAWSRGCVGAPAGRRTGRGPVRPGRPGRPRLGPVGKPAPRRYLTAVEQRVGCGTADAIRAVLAATRRGTPRTTASRERRNAPVRRRQAPRLRRGRALARTEAALTAGLGRVGWAHHCGWYYDRRRLAATLAAGRTDHPWPMAALLG